MGACGNYQQVILKGHEMKWIQHDALFLFSSLEIVKLQYSL